jgi:LysM repeat protein
MARSDGGGRDTRGESLRLAYADARAVSPRASICPFLRSAVDGDLTFPVEAPDASNTCAALEQPLPQSARQQELVCLVSAHATCPRYLRGVLVAPALEQMVPRGRRRLVSPAIAASVAVLAVSTIVSVGYVAAAGGLSVPLTAVLSPSVAPTPEAVTPGASELVAAGSAEPTVTLTPEPSPSAVATPTGTPEPTPTATPAPTPAPTPRPTPKPTARPTPKATATSDRFAVLTPCAGQSNCYVYVIRAGDNLYSIAHWFGVSLDSIYALNPWLRTTPLRAGEELRIPTPTR